MSNSKILNEQRVLTELPNGEQAWMPVKALEANQTSQPSDPERSERLRSMVMSKIFGNRES